MDKTKIKVTKKPPAPSSTNLTGTPGKPGAGGISDADALKSVTPTKGQTLKDVLKGSFNEDEILRIMSDPKQMEKIIPAFFGGIMSLEKLFIPSAGLNTPTKNTLLGLGKGKAGGYGGHPVDGYLQFAPSSGGESPEPYNKDAKDPTKDPNNPSKNKPSRVERASNNKFVKVSEQTENTKFIKVSQQAQANEYEFLKAFENPQAIGQKFVNDIKKQFQNNPNDEAAFAKIVNSYQRTYTNKLKEFFSDSDEGQKILAKITPRK